MKKISELDKSSFEWKLLLIGKINPQIMESYLDKLTVIEIKKLIANELRRKRKKETFIIPIVRVLKWITMLVSFGLCGLFIYRIGWQMQEVLKVVKYQISILIFVILVFLIGLVLFNFGLFLLHRTLIKSIQNSSEKIEFMDKYLKFKLKKIRENNCVSD